MTFIYDLAFLIFALVSIPKFLVRLNQAQEPMEMLFERFGTFRESFKRKFCGRQVVWLHAVSVGEVMALRRWIELFSVRYPNWILALSVTTPTGHHLAKKFFSDRAVVFYAPFDISFVVRRLLSLIQPKLLLLMETEIWPNLISEAARAGVVVGILNGRISPRSFRRYDLVRRWMKAILGKISFCLVQSEHDRGRFLMLGMPEARVTNVGNMKFDQTDGIDQRQSDRVAITGGSTRNGPVLIAGSTSWNEEELVLRVFKELRKSFHHLQLVLAPRHPERISKVVHAIKRAQLPVQRYSEIASASTGMPPRNDVIARQQSRRGRSNLAYLGHVQQSKNAYPILLVDQIGVLASLYRLADVVFMGGSLVRRGGQNPIEAARFRKPLLHGPNVFNFSEVYQALDERGGARCVRSKEELFEKLKLLLEQPELREQMGSEAFCVVEMMKGATMKTMDFLSRWLRSEERVQTMVPS